MSLTDPTVKQQLSEMKGLLTEQGSALTQVRVEAAETKRALSSADAQIEALMREVKSLKETTKTSVRGGGGGCFWWGHVYRMG